MKKSYLALAALLLGASSVAQAEWFLRGTHNNWQADQMQDVGSNTMLAEDVVFTADGNIKFDRWGDWSENYGLNGVQGGGNISVLAGTWDIEFYTDTHDYQIIAAGGPSGTDYHLRGTFNSWAEDTLLAREGETDIYTSCQDFTGNTNPRFKVDPNGGWGGDELPAADYTVAAGWVAITFDAASGNISTDEGLAENCGTPASDADGDGVADAADLCPNTPAGTPVDSDGCAIVAAKALHLRGTHNSWAQGDLMSQIAGTGQYEACRNFTSGDANGGPRFKVDPDGAWGSDAFPAIDQPASGWTEIVVDGDSNSLVSVTTGLGENCGDAPPPTADFRNRSIYFVFLDRFHNGDTSNDNGNNAAATSTSKSAGGLSEWKKYWGGDIQGLIDKLDYLEALGVSAIWVTPLNDNIDNSGSEGAYHGYWGRDFYEVDEHLGDWALVDQLDAEMEARGMKLVLDIALNHSNQDDQYEFGALYKEGTFITDGNQDNGTWYHHNGAIADCGDSDPTTTCGGEWNDPWAFRNKTLFNLTDFNHGTSGNSAADQYLIDAALKWMSHGVDAFRIDAIKHIEPSYINRFTSAVRAQNPDVYVFGEWYGAGAGESLSMQFLNEGRGSELLDFQLRNHIESAIAGDLSMVQLSNHIGSRPGAMNGRDSWQPIFLDNHDATRTSVYLQTTGPVDNGRTGKGFSKALADARQNLGMALVMTLPGIPTIYYGSEQNSTWFTANGDGQVGHDPFNREGMPSFSQSTPAFQLISALASLRADSPALASGSYNERWVNSDVLVFERIEGTDVVTVAVNRGGSTSISVSNLALADGQYSSHVGSDSVSVSGGSAVLNLDANEVIVLH
ncbi:alpha-amylase family glycosyl hydrolase [Microbulbifer hydrolyticus]|uniref:Alpha-amylase n=1 Tax=Microbulbifer hydrolyticus TaxID=48074 RepID=A0A6P1TEH4_9GAMM|nr:alpha-amylase family glycosyl hydrolase [Microbulbifer hydrolyticus]MBB5212636.1 glycosidase [Microbulbifer hydrolyticus]QHQ40241.1 alpha-amylase [Microbulbifer hydrolyticus]